MLKIYSEIITHKSDVGGVKLNLRGAAAVRRAYREIAQGAAAFQPPQGVSKSAPSFLGVTVQPMIANNGYELILGSSIDPQFGPVLLFGTGGYLVEVFKDRALGLPPLNRTLARRLMERTQIYSALKKGFRGREPIDLPALEDLLVRFSQLVIEQRWIKEIDINPLLVSPKQIVALDARVVLHDPQTREADLPRSPIRPYPSEYVITRKIGGVEVTIRPIRPEDEPLMVKFHKTLSDRSVHLRYFGLVSLERRIMHERLRRVCFIDYDREIALVVDLQEPRWKTPDSRRRTSDQRTRNRRSGVCRSDQRSVARERFWLGAFEIAGANRTQRSLRRITGHISPENTTMKTVSEQVGFSLRFDKAEGEWKAEIVL